MFIYPSKDMLDHCYKCNYFLGKYLEENGIPVFYKDNKKYYFAKTDELKFKLDNLPIAIKIRSFFE